MSGAHPKIIHYNKLKEIHILLDKNRDALLLIYPVAFIINNCLTSLKHSH